MSTIRPVSGILRFIPGISPAIRSVNRLLAEVACTNIPVLLIGESGTGKDAYAQRIHQLCGNSSKSFKKINCAGLDAQTLKEPMPGITVPRGQDGESSCLTLFLDQIDELDCGCQRALLPLLPDAETSGGDPKPTARLIAATTCDLEREMSTGRFRRDLYFRINGVSFGLPPLRERKEDIPLLMEHFLTDYAKQLQKKVPEIKTEDMEFLVSHPWPGNIRELRNLAKMTVVLGSTLLAITEVRHGHTEDGAPTENVQMRSLKIAAREASHHTERELILKTLERTHWNRKRAAQELQISYKSLLHKLKRIEMSGLKSNEKLREQIG